jgi:hypothetical protein
MFDLDREVRAWSAQVHAERCQRSMGVDELVDHLHCEIDRVRATGMSDEDAFRAAVMRLGSISDLSAEHAKNRSALGTACEFAQAIERTPAKAEHRWLLISNAILWAALMIAASMVLAKAASPEISGSTLALMMVPLWWASDQILRQAMRQKGSR